MPEGLGLRFELGQVGTRRARKVSSCYEDEAA